jgi:ketosteroid isomerase-like protein
MSTNLSAVLQEILQNTTNLKVLRQLMTPDVTYVSLSFDNPELKKVMPWTGTHKGPEALADVFGAIQRFWKTLDFKVTDTIEQGSRVAFFGSFTYKSNATGKEITSPLACWRASRGTRLRTSSFSRTATALQVRSKLGALHGSTAIPRGKRLRSKAE